MVALLKEIDDVKNKLMNYSILCLLIITLPATIFSIIHLVKEGHFPDYGVGILQSLLILFLFLIRNIIGQKTKANLITISFIIGGLAGNLFFGSLGDQFLTVIGIALISLFYGKKPGIFYFFVAFIGFLTLEILFRENIIERDINYNEYFSDVRNWIISFITLTITALILIFSISYFNHFLISLVDKLGEKNGELDTLNTAYKNVMSKVEESEKKYKSIFETLREGVILTNEKGDIIDCNKAAECILDISKEDILQINLHQKNFHLVYPDLSPVPNEECPGVKTLINGFPINNFEVGMRTKRDFRWLILNSASIKAKGYGVFLTLNDITDFKKLESNQIIFNRYFEAFLENIEDYVVFRDREGKIIFCSQSLAQITGYSDWRDIIGRNYEDIFPGEIAKTYKEEDDVVYQTGEKLIGKVNTFLIKNSEIRYEQTNKIPLFDDDRNVVGIISIGRDITEILREKELIQEKEEKINLLLNSAAEGIYGVDVDGNCTFANKSCVNMLGYSSEDEMLGRNIHKLIHHSYASGKPMDLSECKMQATILNNVETHSEDEVFWRKDGTKVEVEYFSFPQVQNGKVIGYVVTFLDISERKKTEKQIISFAKDLQKLNSDKDKFIRILAHDLKNPFNSIIGFSEYIIQNLGSIEKDEIEEFTKMINDSSEKAYTLLEEILLWLKVQSGQLSVQKTKIELRNIVLNIIENLSPLAQNKSIKLNCNIPQDVYIEADINMFKTILRNLITNSIKFTNENGEIEVNIEEIEKRIKIIVADNGVGMSQDLAKNLFTDQVNQTEEGTKGEKGTGLGLTIIKELVQKHKELIWAESEIGKGSRFIVTMPKITKKDEETI